MTPSLAAALVHGLGRLAADLVELLCLGAFVGMIAVWAVAGGGA